MTEFKLHNLFFALWPDRAVRTELLRLQQSLSGHSGRMQHGEDLHMTLVFLGQAAPERLDCVRQVAASIVTEPLALELNKTGYWKRPRILWCSPEHTPDPLSRLVQDLQQGLTSCGFQPENRIYRPHVTLARKARPIADAKLAAGVIWRPREFVLAGSHSGAEVPRYRVLSRWRLP